ncbi:CRE-NAS-31 protein [Aphelenchoides avenae]|nr:CRE-NAS-31 protein [Aphelenchus avenae]
MGIYHEQSRPDRDNYIELIPANFFPGLADQYKVAKTSLIYDTVYDYTSNMHYPGYDDSGTKMLMRAKETAYQHSMGGGYGPSFQDIKLLNEHYKCFAHLVWLI